MHRCRRRRRQRRHRRRYLENANESFFQILKTELSHLEREREIQTDREIEKNLVTRYIMDRNNVRGKAIER